MQWSKGPCRYELAMTVPCEGSLANWKRQKYVDTYISVQSGIYSGISEDLFLTTDCM